MKTSMRNIIAACLVATITALVGCGESENKAPKASKSFDAKAIAIQKFKGDNGPFQEVTAACVVELEASGKCDGHAADYLIKKTAASPIGKVTDCLVEVKKDEALKACKALTDSASTFDLISAQRPMGRYDEKRARQMWGSRFIEFGE